MKTENQLSEEIRSRLISLADEKYREFTTPIICTSKNPVIGVRLPSIKKVAKEYSEYYKEISILSVSYFEEIMLKGMAIGVAKAPISEKLPYIRDFVKQIDNWSVCDSFCSSLKIKNSEEDELKDFARSLVFSDDEFESRVAVVLWFGKFHDEGSCDEAFSQYRKIKPGRYYTDMAVAWGISVYCVYFPEKTVKFLKDSEISTDIKKKAAQKIRDSFRISDEIKKAVTSAVNGEKKC